MDSNRTAVAAASLEERALSSACFSSSLLNKLADAAENGCTAAALGRLDGRQQQRPFGLIAADRAIARVPVKNHFGLADQHFAEVERRVKGIAHGDHDQAGPRGALHAKLPQGPEPVQHGGDLVGPGAAMAAEKARFQSPGVPDGVAARTPATAGAHNSSIGLDKPL